MDELVVVGVVLCAERGYQHDLDGFSRFGVAFKSTSFVLQILVGFLIEGVFVPAIFHLANVDDAVVTIDDKVDLCTVVSVAGFAEPRCCVCQYS